MFYTINPIVLVVFFYFKVNIFFFFFRIVPIGDTDGRISMMNAREM